MTVTGVDVYEENITSKEITKLPKVYVVGRRADATAGFVGTNRVTSGAYVYNYDSAALKLMNFEQVADPAKADVIMGGNAIRNDSAAIDAVKAGTPYITYTSNSASNVGNFVSGTKRAGLSGAMDCLAFVEYPEETMVNASYINENDTIMYGYNAGSFTSVPKGAKVLVTVKNETPLEGFVPTLTEPAKAAFDKYLDGGILGFEYTGDDLDIAAFSQTLTNKIHQRDEFQFISNFIFSRMLGDEYDGAANDTTNETIAALEQQLEEARKGNNDQIQALIDKLEAAEAKVADLEKKNADKEAQEESEVPVPGTHLLRREREEGLR